MCNPLRPTPPSAWTVTRCRCPGVAAAVWAVLMVAGCCSLLEEVSRRSRDSYFPRLFSGSHDSSGSALGRVQRHKCAGMQSCDGGRKDGRVLTLLLTGSWGRGKTCPALFCSSCCWLRHTGCQVCSHKEAVALCGLTGIVLALSACHVGVKISGRCHARYTDAGCAA